jgi:GYF domain 2
MADQWIINVQGKEFGPVDVETLHEWKREGRLLAQNPARRVDLDFWTTAGEIPGLFESLPATGNGAPLPIYHRSFTQIFSETFQIYRKGFFSFFCFSLLTGIPAFFLQLNLPAFEIGNHAAASWNAIRPGFFSLSMCALFAVVWPIFLSGIQLTSAGVVQARDLELPGLFGRSIRLWPRMAKLSLLVYGSYFIWSALPLVVAGALILGEPSVVSILLALLILTFQVFMTARLWINFMFWQQSAALGDLTGLAALRESKMLARSRRGEHWLERPLYRGAIIVSIWIVLAMIVGSAVQLPFVFVRLQGATNLEQMQTILQNLASARPPEPLMLAAYATNALVHAAIRPLLGIAFVILYFDAKSGQQESKI